MRLQKVSIKLSREHVFLLSITKLDPYNYYIYISLSTAASTATVAASTAAFAASTAAVAASTAAVNHTNRRNL